MKPEIVAHIDYSALSHNLRQVRERVGSRRILAMIKSDGYGHGLVRIAQGLSSADAFGVASIEEGIRLREAGFTHPILVMSRFYYKDQLPFCLQYQLSVVIYGLEQVALFESAHLSKPIHVWLKLETGMNRLGLLTEEFTEARQRLNGLAWVHQPIGSMTHLACADLEGHPLNASQVERFTTITANLPGPKSIGNSAAILTQPNLLADWVRPGLMLYGASPFAQKTADNFELKPVMTLTSTLIAVRKAQRGEAVGYGATWQCPEDMALGVVAIGYGDGYPWHAVNGTPVLINGSFAYLVGRVSMDMITIDLRSVPNAKVGDEVVLWGKGLPIEQIAHCAATIPYELFCHLTRRVNFLTHD